MRAEMHDAHVHAWIKNAAHVFSRKAMRDGFKPQAVHEYTDRAENPLHWKIRLKHPDTNEKWLRPMRREAAGFVLKEPEYLDGKPLYRLHDLASRPDDAVIVVEGESCADELIKKGALATTSGAADSAEKADWSIMAGRTVLIWPDNDEAGRRYGESVHSILLEMKCTVRIIDVDALNLPLKADSVDWLKANCTATLVDIAALPTVDCGKLPTSDTTVTGDTKAFTGTETPDDVIQRLAALPAVQYDRVRKIEAEALGIRPGTLDKLVVAVRKDDVNTGLVFDEVEPWPDPINPAQLLTDISDVVRRFIVCQEETADAVALWSAMTWLMEVVQVAPLAIITAPEKRCGKSQLLFLLGRLVSRPLTASNISPAALFRSIDAWKPTLLVDEADSFMRENEELRGLLNCGHTRDSAYIVRTVGEDFTPKKFNVWGAKALAGIGHLADTLMDRSILLELRRKLPHEQVDRLRYAEPGLFDDLAAKLARFAHDYSEDVRRARPALPESLNDRAQDNWEPLLAIAEVAGGVWTDLARKAALKLSGADNPSQSIGTELLMDIQEVFDAKRVTRITTADLITALCGDDEKPWITFNRGKPMNPRQLARKLDGYGIKSKNLKIGYGDVKKGFDSNQFEEAFSRYLTVAPSPENIRYPLQVNGGAASTVADRNMVAATQTLSATLKPTWHKAGSGVADSSPETSKEKTSQVEVEI